jgi:site-specific DNA-methyltransferase (adenine-specific)
VSLPKPYYEHAGITIYHADCRDILPHLPKVDLVLTDPPYSDQVHKGARTRNSNNPKALVDFDSISLDDIRAVIEKLPLDGWFVATMAREHTFSCETDPPTGFEFMQFGVWVKPNSAPQFTGDKPATGWESVCIMRNNKRPWDGGGKRAVWQFNTEQSGHPTSKPVKLFTSFIQQFGGDTILDPFMGSGTTLVAAKLQGKRAIGIEREEKYCEIAVQRLGQDSLFMEESA